MSRERVTGIGGIFFKAKDADKLRAWYKEHLGVPVEEYGGAMFPWRDKDRPDEEGMTIWSIASQDTRYYEPSQSSFMINYRVRDLKALLAQLRAEGVEPVGDMEESEYGRFAWLLDPEGNKVELWEPPQKK
ncbi:MAG TPA: VOC family protein [Polyangia bacterium]|jgi:predicted enzyme related to lactoylglutathione lyase|nr:VOC family protein [Polyangia bacterium]